MARFSWTFDAPTGVWKNHAISKKLRKASLAVAKIVSFTRPEPGYGKRKGESVLIQRVRNIAQPSDATFDEGDPIPVDQLLVSKTSITPVQMGRAIEIEDLAEQLNNFDLNQPIQYKLRGQMRLELDRRAAVAFKTAKIKFIPTSAAGGVFDTDGTPSTQATYNVGVEHCGVIRDYLMDTLHCDPYNESDDSYVGLGATKLLRGIKNDPLFIAWKQYLREGATLYHSEVGMIENIRWVEINHTNALSNAKGLASVLGEGLVFGNDGVALAEVEMPQLRYGIPANFGLQKAVAWYANLEFGIVWDTANDGEAKVIHITSS